MFPGKRAGPPSVSTKPYFSLMPSHLPLGKLCFHPLDVLDVVFSPVSCFASGVPLLQRFSNFLTTPDLLLFFFFALPPVPPD